MLPNRTALLNTVCIIRKKIVTQDEFGNPQEAYMDMAPVRCRARELTAGESPQNGQLTNLKFVRFYLTTGTEIAEEDQIVWSGKVYEVENVDILSGQVGLTQGLQVDTKYISTYCSNNQTIIWDLIIDQLSSILLSSIMPGEGYTDLVFSSQEILSEQTSSTLFSHTASADAIVVIYANAPTASSYSIIDAEVDGNINSSMIVGNPGIVFNSEQYIIDTNVPVTNRQSMTIPIPKGETYNINVSSFGDMEYNVRHYEYRRDLSVTSLNVNSLTTNTLSAANISGPQADQWNSAYITLCALSGDKIDDITQLYYDPDEKITSDMVADESLFTITSAGVITGYTGGSTISELVIPYKINNIYVRSIITAFPSPFSNNNTLTKVVAPNTLTSIGGYAFSNCSNISAVNFPSATSISLYAFSNCSNLSSLNFPKATIMGNKAFWGCTSLVSVNLPSITIISEESFLSCSNLESIDFPEVTEIGIRSFKDCTSLQTLKLPLLSVIYLNAFQGCTSLVSVILPSVTEVYSGFTDCTNLISVTLPSVTNIGKTFITERNSFVNCVNLTNLTLGPEIPDAHSTIFDTNTAVTTYAMYSSSWVTQGNTWHARPLVLISNIEDIGLDPIYGSEIITPTLSTTNSYTTDWHYFSSTWRQGVSGDDLLVQKYDGADWVTKAAFN